MLCFYRVDNNYKAKGNRFSEDFFMVYVLFLKKYFVISIFTHLIILHFF